MTCLDDARRLSPKHVVYGAGSVSCGGMAEHALIREIRGDVVRAQATPRLAFGPELVDFVPERFDLCHEIFAGLACARQVFGREFDDHKRLEPPERPFAAGEEKCLGALDVELHEIQAVEMGALGEIVERHRPDRNPLAQIGQPDQRPHALVLFLRVGDPHLLASGSVRQGHPVGADDFLQALALDVLGEAIEDVGDGFETVHGAGLPDPAAEPQADQPRISAGVEANHPGADVAVNALGQCRLEFAERDDMWSMWKCG
ncbi:MAG: hypothetical protein JWN51_3645 [Phycisphaerales bacterium]|nr:hypothetical protein [Phycisphaerales bacterium]